MKNNAIIGFAALLAGAAGGYIAGKAGGPENNKAADNQAEVLNTSKTSRPAAGSGGSASSKGPRDVKSALSEPGQLSRMQALMDIYNGMGADQLKDAAEKLDQLSGAERMMASFLLFGRWGEVDPQGALAFANTQGFGGAFARPTILQSWASTDPVGAAKYFSEHPNELRGGFGGPGGGGFGGNDGAGVIAAEWAKLDPKAALEWAKGLNGGDKRAALNSVIGQMAAKDPAQAATIAATLDTDDQPRAYGEIASKWATTDFAAAQAWIATLPEASRDRALAEALQSYAGVNPVGAAGQVASMADGEERDRAVNSVAGAWARQDPAAAAAWLTKQQSENIDDAVRSVVGTWTGKDAPAALAFIQSQPQGELRDAATATYIWSNRSADPQTSIQLAESISDENSRNRSIGMSVMRWMQDDKEAATAYVQSSTTLSDETKQRLIEGQGRGGRGGPGGGGGFGGGGGGRRGGN